MKRFVLLTSLVALLFAHQCGLSQGVIGFTNLNGFPQLVENGTHYNLSGWIVNNGNAPFSGNIDIQMLVIGGNTLNIDNNFNLNGALAPGDSVFWTKNNHNFPPGQFRLGYNDVLIWPTVSSGTAAESDTLGAPVYYANGAVMRIDPTSFDQFSAGWDFARSYDLDIKIRNIGSSPTAENVMVYVSMKGQSPEILAGVEHFFESNEEATVSIHNVNLSEIFRTTFASSEEVAFYAKEATVPTPFNQVDVAIVQATSAAPSQAAVQLRAFPNPAHGSLYIDVPAAWKVGAIVNIYDVAGKLQVSKAFCESISLAGLVPGYYFLEIDSPKGKLQQRVIVE
jgi:hypothetical protein